MLIILIIMLASIFVSTELDLYCSFLFNLLADLFYVFRFLLSY
jgi:hypothetical protein